MSNKKIFIFANISAILFLVIFSAAFRFSGISKNYPYMNYVDEGHIVRHAMNMYRDNNTRAHWYQYPSGMMNITIFTVKLYNFFSNEKQNFREQVKVYPLVNFYRDKYSNKKDIELNYNICDPPIFLMGGRFAVALMGTISVIFMFFILRIFFPFNISFLGAVVFSLIPAVTIHSQVVNNDIPMTLASSVIIFSTFYWSKTTSLKYLMIAALFTGFSTSCKYSGFLFVGFIGFVVFAQNISLYSKIKCALICAPFYILGVYLIFPGLFGIEAEVINTFLWDLNYYKTKTGNYPSALLVLSKSNEMGLPILIFGTLGFICSFFDKQNRRIFVPCIIWLSLFLWTFLRHTYQPPRNLFQTTPIVLLFCVYFIWIACKFVCIRRQNYHTYLTSAVLSILIIFQFFNTYIKQKEWLNDIDSRITATNWLRDNINSKSSVIYHEGLAVAPVILKELNYKNNLFFQKREKLEPFDSYLSGDYILLPARLQPPSKPNEETQPTLDKLLLFLDINGYSPVFETSRYESSLWYGFWRNTKAGITIYKKELPSSPE